jgi:5'-3' exoribonuclease 1
MADPDNGFEGLQLDTCLKHVPEMQQLPMLTATKAWIKSTPAARRPLVSKFSRIAAEEAVKALLAATSGPPARTNPVALEAVSPLLLMLPVTAGEVMDLYAGGDFDLGDRVVMVGDSGSPPFGSRGYVVAMHGEAAEVMFDAVFVGGTDLHGVLPDNRGLMLPSAQLVNLSHPPAMPQLGTAAPPQVLADKKGKSTLPKGFQEAWTPESTGGKSSVLAMAAASLPRRGGMVGSAPSPQPKGPRMPVMGSKGFDPGMGRGSGGARGRGEAPGAATPVRTLGALTGEDMRASPLSPAGADASGLMAMLKGAAADAAYAADAADGNDIKALLDVGIGESSGGGGNGGSGDVGGGGWSRAPPPAPLEGADVLKSMLGISSGGGGTIPTPIPTAPVAPIIPTLMTLEQLEQRMSSMPLIASMPSTPSTSSIYSTPTPAPSSQKVSRVPAPKLASAPYPGQQQQQQLPVPVSAPVQPVPCTLIS